MAKRLAELGALQDAVSNNESNPSRLGLAGYIRGLFLDWSANPYNPLTRLSARGRLLGYFWDNGAIGLSMDFVNQSFIVKDGTLQSKPFSDIVNFSRTSNATVTNSAGVITYAPHNLLTYSEQFDNAAWTKTTTTITANAIASPTSTTTGDTLTAGGANSTTLHSYTAIAQAYTFSIYIRRRTGTGNIQITADGSTYVTKTITSDWTRFDTTITPTAGTRTPGVRIVTSGDAIDVWGAQIEIGSTATTYNPTTVKNLLGYSELFDNAAWTKSNSFVQTNLLTYSEAFDNAAWAKALSSVSANVITSPNGYQTGDKLIASASSGVHNLSQGTFNLPIASFSIYAKKGEYNFCTLIFIGGGIRATRTFNLTTGAVTNPYDVSATTISATATDVGDGWYKLNLSSTSTSFTAVNIALAVDTVNNHTFSGQTFTGDGTSGIYLWGAQVVSGSVAGDYRRTDAAALPIYYANHNGVVCAEQLHGTAANATILESYTATGGSMTFSVWMRRITGTGNVDITMDTGTTWTTQAITTTWARYSITSTPASGARTAGIRLVTSGDIIQVFGGQVSDSASLDPYVLNAAAAPTAAAYYGARFDYNPVTLAPKGLLIEEQRANLFLNSSLAGTNLATQSVTVTAVAHTLSFYGTGTVTLTGTAIATAVGDGAYPTRKTLTFTPTAGVVLFTVTGTVQYAQLEIGSFATSFIPTAASQVTRTADVATIQGSNFYSWYNQNEGSFVYAGDRVVGASSRQISISDGTNANYVSLYSAGTDALQYLTMATNSATQADISRSPVSSGVLFKQAASFVHNNVNFVLNNGSVLTDSAAVIPNVDRMNIGLSPNNVTAQQSQHVKSISYYPTRLNNDTLKGLTA